MWIVGRTNQLAKPSGRRSPPVSNRAPWEGLEAGLIRSAVLAGYGLAYVPARDVAEDLPAGRLVQVLADWTPPFPGVCLYDPGRRHVPAELRAFIDLVQERRRA